MEAVTFGNGLPGFEIGSKSSNALIVIQEWWGINAEIKEVAERLHKETGLRVLVPDLYKGKIGVDAEEASHLMNSLDFGNAVAELKSAAEYLKATGSAKVGCTGFCMGGALTLAAMSAGMEAACAAPFYGIPDARFFDISSIKAPLLGHFGELDKMAGFSDPAAGKAAADKVNGAGGSFELVLVPSGGHGYMNALCANGAAFLTKCGNPVPSAEDVQATLDRLKAFFGKHLV